MQASLLTGSILLVKDVDEAEQRVEAMEVEEPGAGGRSSFIHR